MKLAKRAARKRWPLVLLVPTLALAVGACGSSGQSQSASNGHAQTTVAPVKLAMASVAMAYAPVYVALVDGLFKKYGVDVEIPTYTGGDAVTAMLASGQIDVLPVSQGVAVSMIKQQPVVELMNTYNYDRYTYAVVATKGITSVADLAAKGNGCRIATGLGGTATYLFAAQYARAYNLKCQTRGFGEAPEIAAAVLAGQDDIGIVDPATAATLTAAKQGIHELYDPLTASAEVGDKIIPNPYPLLAIMGVRSTVEKKRQSIVRMLAALQEALKMIEGMTPAQLADTVAKDTKAWAGTPKASILAAAEAQIKEFPGGDAPGQITQQGWASTLDSLKAAALPGFNPNANALTYDSAVDMSYLGAAAKLTQ